jgi:NTP pyrophosphatase (non-canonical NTP hydrolase)
VTPKEETRMDFNSYQREALRTDRVPTREGADDAASLIVPMLGLAGETGQLLSEYKKHLRDGEAHRLFKDRVSEELGDLLWYIANVASKFDLSLSEIAVANLAKVKGRWSSDRAQPLSFDAELPEGERLPRQFEVELIDVEGEAPKRVRVVINGKSFGGELTDNAYDPDGYRFHDVFHFAYAAVLGWSPITRALLRRKRKSRPVLDEVEDGGRAAVIEEGVAALAFDYARRHCMLEGVAALDFQLLRTIKDMTSHLEVSQRATGEWEQAILQGFHVWRAVFAARGGRIAVDLDARRVAYLGPAAPHPSCEELSA